MDANTEICLVRLHEAIAATIAAAFPELVTVAAYPEERDAIPVPACLFELEEFEADGNTGTGQLSGTANFAARFLIRFNQAGMAPKLEIRRLALAFAAFAKQQRWGLPVGAAEVVGAWPDDFDPELDQYEVWRVEWRQCIDLGESVWKPSALPSGVWLGQAPNIGPDHLDDYVRISPDE